MDKDLCFFIGYFSKLIGHKGELALRLDVDEPAHYQDLGMLFVQINKRDQELVPFSLDSTHIQNNGIARVKITGIDDLASAKPLVGKSVFLPTEVLPPLSGNQFYFHEITGFEVIDLQKGNIGKVVEVLDYPGQAILQIIHPLGKEVLVPIHDNTIEKVNREQQQLTIDAPEGLIDLYLET